MVVACLVQTAQVMWWVRTNLHFIPQQQRASLTPGAVSGYGVTFTASSGVFTASNVGQAITYGAAVAIITSYTNSTHVVANITQNFPSTGTINAASWHLSSVVPKGLLGYIMAFKPHDTYNATTAATWCNEVQITEGGRLYNSRV